MTPLFHHHCAQFLKCSNATYGLPGASGANFGGVMGPTGPQTPEQTAAHSSWWNRAGTMAKGVGHGMWRNKGSLTGSVVGGELGGTLGATLGSVVPVAGTAIGAVAGSYLGSKLGDSLGSKLDKGINVPEANESKLLAPGQENTPDYMAEADKNNPARESANLMRQGV